MTVYVINPPKVPAPTVPQLTAASIPMVLAGSLGLSGVPMSTMIPVNGFIGSAQQTPAGRLAQMPRGSRSGTRKRRKKKAAAAPRKRKRASSSRKGGKLKKGSAAAKAYMAKIRKKRK